MCVFTLTFAHKHDFRALCVFTFRASVVKISLFGLQLILTETPTLTRGPSSVKREGPTALTAGQNDFTIAIFNVENFPGDLTKSAEVTDKANALGSTIATLLGAPSVVALQELQVQFRC
jgi:hypothetical protein